jgi:tetratricopeptide (TPR) repeat protein
MSSSAGQQPSASGAPALTKGQRLSAALDAKAERKSAKKGKSQEQLQEQVLGLSAQAGRWIAERWTAVLLFGLVAAFVIVVVVTVTMLNRQRQQQAGMLLARAIEVSLRPVQGEPSPQGSEEGAPKPFADAKSRSEASLKAYEKVIKRHPDSAAASWALVGRAHSHYALGQWAEASRDAQKALTKPLADESSDFRAQALTVLAAATEEQGNLGKAVELYSRLEAMDSLALSSFGAYQRARLLAAQNKTEEAAKALRSVVEKTKVALKVAEKNPSASIPYASTVQATEGLLAQLEPGYVPSVSAQMGARRAEPSYGPAGDLPSALGAGGEGNGQQAIDPETLQKLIEQLKAQQQQNAAQPSGTEPGADPTSPQGSPATP